MNPLPLLRSQPCRLSSDRRNGASAQLASTVKKARGSPGEGAGLCWRCKTVRQDGGWGVGAQAGPGFCQASGADAADAANAVFIQ